MLPFAINHMAAPRLSAARVLDVAAGLGCVGVEFRNDLGRPLFDGMAPEAIGAAARDRGLRILALAEVKAFDDFSTETLDAARQLADIAVACGAEAISLIPRNDAPALAAAAHRRALRQALAEILPLLEERGLKGLVEPLGFESCPLRLKAEAAEAIEAVGGGAIYRIVHDTFHHHLSGETAFFPEMTGIVHVSGVTDPALRPRDMRDGHRGLVDAGDRLGNISQLGALRAGGYRGPVSFEPFAADVHAIEAPAGALRDSMEHIAAALAREAA